MPRTYYRPPGDGFQLPSSVALLPGEIAVIHFTSYAVRKQKLNIWYVFVHG